MPKAAIKAEAVMKINKTMIQILRLCLIFGGGSSGCGGGTEDIGLSDTTAPSVILTNPTDAEIDVALNHSLTATFSEAMESETVTATTFIVTAPDNSQVAGTVVIDTSNTIVTFSPIVDFDVNATYTATLTTAAEDINGNAMADDFIWSFTTGATVDSQSPTVSSTNPDDVGIGIAINTSVNATFSEQIDVATLNTQTFTLTAPDEALVEGIVSYDAENDIASFRPVNHLEINTTYTGTLSIGIEDLASLAMSSAYTWIFTTGDSQAEETVLLGTANSFAILGGSTVTNTGLSIINGDLGVSPGTAVTGIPPGNINGMQHAGDTAAAQAILDLTEAYNDAAGRSTAPITVAGNIGGQTLVPGLYKSTSSLEITSGDLTLDAQGDANGVFIFQIASTLTTTTGRQVVLSGGAKAANIYWQVGSSATLGSNSIFKGNILADQSITLTTGAVLDGRALTRIGGVTLDSNTVTTPSP